MASSAWYEEYLRTPHWQYVRYQKLRAEEWRCGRCGEWPRRRGDKLIGMHVHHKTYERLGREEMSDLEVLCIHCHEVEHGRAPDTEWNRIKVARRLAVGVVEEVENLHPGYDDPSGEYLY